MPHTPHTPFGSPGLPGWVRFFCLVCGHGFDFILFICARSLRWRHFTRFSYPRFPTTTTTFYHAAFTHGSLPPFYRTHAFCLRFCLLPRFPHTHTLRSFIPLPLRCACAVTLLRLPAHTHLQRTHTTDTHHTHTAHLRFTFTTPPLPLCGGGDATPACYHLLHLHLYCSGLSRSFIHLHHHHTCRLPLPPPSPVTTPTTTPGLPHRDHTPFYLQRCCCLPPCLCPFVCLPPLLPACLHHAFPSLCALPCWFFVFYWYFTPPPHTPCPLPPTFCLCCWWDMCLGTPQCWDGHVVDPGSPSLLPYLLGTDLAPFPTTTTPPAPVQHAFVVYFCLVLMVLWFFNL